MRTHEGKTVVSGQLLDIDGHCGEVKAHNNDVAHVLVKDAWWLLFMDPETEELMVQKGGQVSKAQRVVVRR